MSDYGLPGYLVFRLGAAQKLFLGILAKICKQTKKSSQEILSTPPHNRESSLVLLEGESKMTEAEFTKKVLDFFQKKLKGSNLPIEVESNNYILRDFTFGKNEKGTWELFCGTQEQDIIFYKDTILRENFIGGLNKISRLNRVGLTGTGLRKDLIIPLALCELKVGTLNTHGIMVASQIALDIKDIFPHCISLFIVSSNIKRRLGAITVLRHGKGFDGVYLNWEKEKGIVWKELLRHFEYCKKRKVI